MHVSYVWGEPDMPALGLCQSGLGGHEHPTRTFDTGDHGPPTTQVAMIVSFYKISLRFRLALLESGRSLAPAVRGKSGPGREAVGVGDAAAAHIAAAHPPTQPWLAPYSLGYELPPSPCLPA